MASCMSGTDDLQLHLVGCRYGKKRGPRPHAVVFLFAVYFFLGSRRSRYQGTTLHDHAGLQPKPYTTAVQLQLRYRYSAIYGYWHVTRNSTGYLWLCVYVFYKGQPADSNARAICASTCTAHPRRTSRRENARGKAKERDERTGPRRTPVQN